MLTKSLAAQDAELASRKAGIEKKIDKLQKLRIQAYGASGSTGGPLRTGPCPVTYTNDKGGRAAQKACSLIGKPYIFGAEGPSGYDCSGLTKTAWASVGVHLEHYTEGPVGPGQAGQPRRAQARRPGLLLLRPAPRGDLRRRRTRSCTPRTPATTCGWRRSTGRRSPVTAAGLIRPATGENAGHAA